MIEGAASSRDAKADVMQRPLAEKARNSGVVSWSAVEDLAYL